MSFQPPEDDRDDECRREAAADAHWERQLINAYAEGRKDEREELGAMLAEEATSLRREGNGCNDGRYDWMAAGVEAVADTLRGIDSATGQPVRPEVLASALAALTPQAPQPEAATIRDFRTVEPVPAPVQPVAWAVFHRDGSLFSLEETEAAARGLACGPHGETVRPLYATPAVESVERDASRWVPVEERMPTEQDAVRAMWEAYHRLEELGWRNATYCPRDGRTVLFIEAGSSGIHEGHCDDQDRAHRRPTVWLHDAGDLWPSQPVLYRELPAAADREKQP